MIINYNNIVFIIIYGFFSVIVEIINDSLSNFNIIGYILGLMFFFFGLFMGQLWKCILGIIIIFIGISIK